MVQVLSRHCILAGLPCDSIVHVKLISLDSVCKEVAHGVVDWFMLICLVESPDAIRAYGLLLVGILEMPRLTIGMICVLSFLIYLNCHQHHSVKLSTIFK